VRFFWNCSTTLQKYEVLCNVFPDIWRVLCSLSMFFLKGHSEIGVWWLVSNRVSGELRFIWWILNKQSNTLNPHPPQGAHYASLKHYHSLIENFRLLQFPVSSQLSEELKVSLIVARLKIVIEDLLEKIQNALFSFLWEPKVSLLWHIFSAIDELPPTKLKIAHNTFGFFIQFFSFQFHIYCPVYKLHFSSHLP
jgi:hypothetical protein